MLFYILIFATLLLFGMVLYYLNNQDLKLNKIKFYRSNLVLPDGTKIFYKNILSITLNTIYVSQKAWEPRIVILYKTQGRNKEFVFSPQFTTKGKHVKFFPQKDCEYLDNLQKLRRYLPNKIDGKINQFLNNDEIKFEELESLDTNQNIKMIKARGSFRMRR